LFALLNPDPVSSRANMVGDPPRFLSEGTLAVGYDEGAKPRR
jgi:hypothetical protein